MPRPSTDFFELQDEARRDTARLVFLYLGAVLGVAAALTAVVAAVYALLILYWGGPLPEGLVLDYSRLVRSYFGVLAGAVPRTAYLWTAGGALAVMVAASLARMWQLREGGEAVADLLGARRIERRGATPNEARLLNVVEEMALAAHIAAPPAYVLEREPAINALAAGYSRDEAVIIVTQGALDKLTRDELQGVIAHEFSHMLNGDMQLNVRLLALLYGIAFIGRIGQQLIRAATEGAIGAPREKQNIAIPHLFAGLLLAAVGYFGLLAARFIQAAISREREYLADAASVQFTRNPDGIAGALDSIVSLRVGSFVWNPLAEEVSHMFCAQGAANALGASFATHPPIDERIRRVHPRFNRDAYRAARGGQYEQREIAVLDGLGNVVETVVGSARD
jgi:Zn-dependent protease with chaperone function